MASFLRTPAARFRWCKIGLSIVCPLVVVGDLLAFLHDVHIGFEVLFAGLCSITVLALWCAKIVRILDQRRKPRLTVLSVKPLKLTLPSLPGLFDKKIRKGEELEP